MVLYYYMKSVENDVHNFPHNMHVWFKVYQEFYHYIVYIVKEGRHIIIYDNSNEILTINEIFMFFRSIF
jgi:hypothetical protein